MTARKAITVEIVGDATKFNNATKNATKSAGKFSNVLQGIGQGIGIAAFTNIANVASQAAGAVVDFVKDSIAAASNLNETITKSEVVFGDEFKNVKKWAESAADTLGLSERAALDAASGFAGLFKTVGIGLKDSTAMSQDITTLGADLASFFNTDMEQALQALKSGLSGESEPLRKFNVFLSETAVSAKLAQMGIKKVGGQFTEAQKSTARYALIMEQTSDAQGDFARTQDGLANSTRTLDAKMENLSAKIGGVLLPVVEKGVGFLLDMASAADTVADSEEDLGTRIDSLADIINHINPLTAAYTWSMDEVKDSQDKAAQAVTDFGVAAKKSARAHQFAGDAIQGSSASMSESVTDDIKIVKKTYAELASYLLGEYSTNFDKAMDIQDARVALSGDLTDREKAEQYATLQELGAMSAKDYEAWASTLERLAAGSKGKVRESYLAALAYIQKLRDEAAKRITFNINAVISSRVASSSGLTYRAAGGPASGPTWVGEKGPELVDLPSGSMVHSNQKSMKMASGGGTTVNIYGPVYGDSIDDLTRRIASRLRLAS